MKILIAPLNWGLGHASRCLPLIVRYLRNGDDVVLAGDGESLTLLRKHFPNLPYYSLAPLNLRYSSGNSQVGAMLRALPALARFIRQDSRMLEDILSKENIDLVISDNRFGLHSKRVRCVYITHQLLVRLPHALRWAENLVHRIHLHYINQFNECWIPDNADAPSLSGDLSHLYPLPANAHFIGPLSRFEYVSYNKGDENTPNPVSADKKNIVSADKKNIVSVAPKNVSADNNTAEEKSTGYYDAVAILSGLEPQRTLFEKAILAEYADKDESLLLVRGKMGEPMTTLHHGLTTIVPYLPDSELADALCHARTIISRSGYSSIMDFATLGLFDKQKRGEVILRLVATPGQPEQEYLESLFS